jgi:DNA mismatch endonuclease, patch repair protein
VDTLTPRQRSERMSRVHAKDTQPELIVRQLLHRLGYRYRIHWKHLPGRPDIVFRNRRKAIFVHGCFWHRHEGCKLATLPKTRTKFWSDKLDGNRRRDGRNLELLRVLGWEALVVWQCETRRVDLRRQIAHFLAPTKVDRRTRGRDAVFLPIQEV